MSADSCGGCRFWKIDDDVEAGDGTIDGNGAFGWCRRNPPQVSDYMARSSIPGPAWGGRDPYDPDDAATVVNVFNSTLFPATYSTGWCGRFQAQEGL